MKEDTKQILESKMLETLQWVEQSIKTTSDFASEQVPLYIQELLVYNFWMSLTWFIVGIIMIISLIPLVRIFIKEIRKPILNQNLGVAMPCLFGSLGLMAGGIVMIAENTDWIKIKLAPRVYIVDYLRKEIK